MFVKISKINGIEYVKIARSVRDKETKKVKQVIVKRLGKLEDLLKEDPNYIQNLKKYYSELSKQESQRKIELAKFGEIFMNFIEEDSDEINYTELTRVKRFDELENENLFDIEKIKEQFSNSSTEFEFFNYGNLVYKIIYEKLKLDKLMNSIKSTTQIKYDFNNIVQNLTYMRILNPCSKLRTYNEYENHFLQNDDTLKSHYRSLEILGKKRLDIIKHINNVLNKITNRKINRAFYDVTTVYFESFTADDLRLHGFSKDQKVNEVQVVLGLMTDANGLPISYKLFPGNTSDFKTFVPFIQEVKENLGIEDITIVADRGLNSGPNLLEIINSGYKFIMAQKIGDAKNKVNGILDLETYEKMGEEFFMKDEKMVKFVPDNDKIKQEIPGKLVLTYSEKRAKKDRYDRERLVEKAKKLIKNSQSIARSELQKGGKKYLDYDVNKITLKEQKIEDDAKWDGFYGIFTNNFEMTNEEVLYTYRKLWQIEESFRILKTTFEVRPIYLWKKESIEGHFALCYLALAIHRLLEFSLESVIHPFKFTTDNIVRALRKLWLVVFKDANSSNKYFLRLKEPIIYKCLRQVLGIKRIPKWGNTKELKLW
ncbi:IS1634 family transposase [Mycoplasmopsis caviae]|uniref:IS1634 family transposase n=1 Tax=Mycoplasmopsis caviae TaxID=55603 RepID=A0ABY5IZZ9_9BACT|nr:IS1634 family transposase [Mycoplasmopsis caviae]UUD35727.1 IS1634 family transposase [Mycoplasmopsis caviae]